MRPVGRRPKKLIVAFHFFRSNPAGWRCDECRKNGLETRRGCGFAEESAAAARKVVWARRGVSTTVCPVSFITPSSVALLEEYSAHRLIGMPKGLYDLPARTVDAFLLLEAELAKDNSHGNE